MRGSDVLLLPEVDYGMARAANRYVARELADALKLNYVFAPCYLALNKGSGVEADAEGDNTLALHGNALMSRFPLLRSHSLALPNGKDKMRGREKRLGSQRVVIADVDHPLGMFRAVTLHVDAHSSTSIGSNPPFPPSSVETGTRPPTMPVGPCTRSQVFVAGC